jgi:cytoskeletal protein RodZ
MSPETIGERLRRARQRSGATLLQASHATKIRPDFLDAMERDSFGFVSGQAYVRGLLLVYARWLRVDAEVIGAEFDRTFGRPSGPSIAEIVPTPAAPAPRAPRNHWVTAAALAASLLLILSLAGIVKPPGREVAAPPPNPGTPEQTASPQSPSVLAKAPAAPEAQAPEQPPSAEGITVVVSAVDRCWMRVEIDGDRAHSFQGTLPAGTSRTFQGVQSIKATFGNLTAVRLTINGRDVGQPGAPGQIVGTYTFTPGSYAPS